MGAVLGRKRDPAEYKHEIDELKRESEEAQKRILQERAAQENWSWAITLYGGTLIVIAFGLVYTLLATHPQAKLLRAATIVGGIIFCLILQRINQFIFNTRIRRAAANFKAAREALKKLTSKAQQELPYAKVRELGLDQPIPATPAPNQIAANARASQPTPTTPVRTGPGAQLQSPTRTLLERSVDALLGEETATLTEKERLAKEVRRLAEENARLRAFITSQMPHGMSPFSPTEAVADTRHPPLVSAPPPGPRAAKAAPDAK